MRGFALKAMIACCWSLVALGSGQALAVHVGCGDVITSDTQLDGDLADCPGDGVVIGADDVTLDLEGHTIDGQGATGTQGVDNSGGYRGLVARNGTIQEFDEGVTLVNATGALLRDLSLRRNRTVGIFLDDSAYNSLDRNSLYGNAHGGSGAGILALGSSNNVIERNFVSGNVRYGMELGGGNSNNRIERNWVTGNGDDGIYLCKSDDNRIERNWVARNRAIGIAVCEAADRDRVAGNVVSDNGESGIEAGELRDGVIEENLVFGNREGIFVTASERSSVKRNYVFENHEGIVVDTSTDMLVERNWVSSNAQGGIVLRAAPDWCWYCFAGGGRVEQNLVAGNGGDGIFVGDIVVGDGFGGTLVEGNRANRNGDDGIDVESPATTIVRNSANTNEDLGIEAAPGVTDGGGNRARRNGNPAQCTNVACRKP